MASLNRSESNFSDLLGFVDDDPDPQNGNGSPSESTDSSTASSQMTNVTSSSAAFSASPSTPGGQGSRRVYTKSEQSRAAKNFEAGKKAKARGDRKKAISLFRKAAELGNAPAQYAMGMAYRYGRLVEEDKEESVRWFRLGAEQNHAPSAHELGYAYLLGWGVPISDSESGKWFRLAEAHGLS